ncbi:MAG: M1 family metallopeptidase [Bacteroidota bacterium]
MKTFKKLINLSFSIIIPAIMSSCNSSTESKTNASPVSDPHSFAKPEIAVTEHLDLDVSVDFELQQVIGQASWKINNKAQAKEIVFDNSGLNISKITINEDGNNNRSKEQETKFTLGKEVKYLGQALQVTINPETKWVNIYYSSGKNASALQWLNAHQTAGKKYPYLFTQSESIAARSWIPCQDSPGIRFTYNAKVSVPKELLALMSAENPQQKNATGVYNFKQVHPIPSYLLALAVGDIAFQSVDNRTGIYAEPAILAKASYEFADMGKMVHTAEKLYGPYRWGRFDMLVLPPSFPFGGMENPNLTFITPTIIAGDRSLVSIICHELAHSWSGNLVTNATWNDFWLNEGFTNYFERRIDEVLYGKQEAEIQQEFGKQALEAAVKDMGLGNKDTRLKADYTGRSADDGTNDIAYEKGYFFLRTLEEAVGRAKFDTFLRGWFDEHAFQSVSTEQFVAYLEANLIKGDAELSKKINVQEWVYGTGIPANVAFGNSLWSKNGKFTRIKALAAGVAEGQIDSEDLVKEIRTSNEKRFFISMLPKQINLTTMADLDKVFDFTNSGNTDIQLAWYELAINSNYATADARIKSYLIENGRMWHIIPLYKALMKTPQGVAKARDIYKLARPNYHPMTYKAIDELLK